MSYPMTSAMAALRALRRAAWWAAPENEVVVAVASLVEPMDALERSWCELTAAVAAWEAKRSDETWGRVFAELGRFDDAVGAFHGPSGWEPQRRSVKGKRPRSTRP